MVRHAARRHLSSFPHQTRSLAVASPSLPSREDGIWVSSTLLAAAFERFCQTLPVNHRAHYHCSHRNCPRRRDGPLPAPPTGASRRSLGHIPGPLEARRRLGKRHHGHLDPLRHAASPPPPPWALRTGLTDISRYSWEPPLSGALLEGKQRRRVDMLSGSTGRSSWGLPLRPRPSPSRGLLPAWFWKEPWRIPPAGSTQERFKVAVEPNPPQPPPMPEAVMPSTAPSPVEERLEEETVADESMVQRVLEEEDTGVKAAETVTADLVEAPAAESIHAGALVTGEALLQPTLQKLEAVLQPAWQEQRAVLQPVLQAQGAKEHSRPEDVAHELGFSPQASWTTAEPIAEARWLEEAVSQHEAEMASIQATALQLGVQVTAEAAADSMDGTVADAGPPHPLEKENPATTALPRVGDNMPMIWNKSTLHLLLKQLEGAIGFSSANLTTKKLLSHIGCALASLIRHNQVSGGEIRRACNQIWDVVNEHIKHSPHMSRGIKMRFFYSTIVSAIRDAGAGRLGIDPSFWDAVLTNMAKDPTEIDPEFDKLFIQIVDAVPHPQAPRLQNGILAVLRRYLTAWTRHLDWGRISDTIVSATKHSVRLTRQIQTVETRLFVGPRSRNVSLTWLESSWKRLGRAMKALEAAEAAAGDHHRHILAISRALRSMSPIDDRQLLRTANELVLAHQALCKDTDLIRQLRYNWLVVLARMPRVKQGHLEDIYRSFFGKVTQWPVVETPLEPPEICSLILHHWDSTGVEFCQETLDTYANQWIAVSKGDGTSLVSLAVSVWSELPRVQQTEALRSFWGFLACQDQTMDMARSLALTLLQGNPPPRGFLLRLVATSCDHRAALRIRYMYKEQLRLLGLKRTGPGNVSQWRPATLRRFVDAIIADRDMSPGEVFRALDIVPQRLSWDRQLSYKRRVLRANVLFNRGSWGCQRIAMIRHAAHRFSSPRFMQHRTWRTRFQCFDRCIRFLWLNKALTPDVFAAFYRAAFANDLYRGKAGVVARIVWFVKLLAVYYGNGPAHQLALAIERRRQWFKRCQNIPPTVDAEMRFRARVLDAVLGSWKYRQEEGEDIASDERRRCVQTEEEVAGEQYVARSEYIP